MTRTPARQPWVSGPQLIVLGAALVLLVTAVAISFSHRPTVSLRAPMIVATGRSDASAVLDPARFSEGQQQEAYMAARAIPAVLNQLYCWCHCRESTIFHHRSLLECFESDHGSQCSTCMGEATLAYKMVKGGINDVRQIQRAIDAQFGPQSSGST
jgi:hypothetical protein